MPSAKDIHVAPISAKDAAALVKRVHYSGKVVQNSQLHLGVFLNGRLEGVMQFGPSLDKRKVQGLVEGTGWNGFIELNRMAFSDRLPRNSESRALGIAMRMIRKAYPHIEWVISFKARERLTVPILPFSKIDEMGAGMYRCKARPKDQALANPARLGGETPTRTLHNSGEAA